MRWRPTIVRDSERPAWMQVLRGLGFFAVFAIVLIAVAMSVGWTRGKWDRHQRGRRERAALAAVGLRRMCSGPIDAGCRDAAAAAAGVPVAFARGRLGDLLVSTGPPRADANPNLAPVTPAAVSFRWAAFEQIWSDVDNVLEYD